MNPLALRAFRDELMKIAAGTPVFSMAVRGGTRVAGSSNRIAGQIATATPRPLTMAEQAISGMKKQPYVPLQNIHPQMRQGVETQRALAELQRQAQQVHGAVTPKMPSAAMAGMAAA